MNRTTLTDFIEDVETTEQYNGYFCSIAEAISIVVQRNFCRTGTAQKNGY